jgi:hypothetical protein
MKDYNCTSLIVREDVLEGELEEAVEWTVVPELVNKPGVTLRITGDDEPFSFVLPPVGRGSIVYAFDDGREYVIEIISGDETLALCTLATEKKPGAPADDSTVEALSCCVWLEDARQISWELGTGYTTAPGIALYVDGTLIVSVSDMLNGTTAYAVPAGHHTVEMKLDDTVVLASCHVHE